MSGMTLGQDLLYWGFEFKFYIDKKIDYKEVVDVEFYVFGYDNNKSQTLKYNPNTNEYNLKLSYDCIGCDYKRAHPSDIYIKVSVKDFFTKSLFSFYVPIYFERPEGRNSWSPSVLMSIELGKIYLSDFINDYSVGDNNEILPPYETIEVKADKSIHKRRKGEYEYRRMNRLVKVELENEN